jgi:hypothetical protein
VSLTKVLGKVLLLGVIEIGILTGGRIPREQIEEIMKLSQPKMTHVVRNDAEGDKKGDP